MELTDLERNEIQNLLYGYDCEYIPQLKEATNKIYDYVQKLVGQIEPLVMPKIAEEKTEYVIQHLIDTEWHDSNKYKHLRDAEIRIEYLTSRGYKNMRIVERLTKSIINENIISNFSE